MLFFALIIISLSSICWALPIDSQSAPKIANPEINPGLFEGDIAGFHPNALQGSLIPESIKWPKGVIVYQIDTTLTATQKAILQAAIDGYTKQTCITFKKRTTEKDYISIQKQSGCWSYLGRVGGKQVLSLADGCWRSIKEPGTVQHEFLHALGFIHEQSRPDRDKFVTINTKNIQAGLEGNFMKYAANQITTSGTAYDYGSVMHYNAFAFAKDSSKPTITVPAGKTIGQRVALSTIDIQEINKRYNCFAG